MMHKAWSGIEEVFLFRGHPSNLKVTRVEKWTLGSDFSVSKLQLQFKFMDDYKMTHIASRSMEEVFHCFSRSSVKFQGHMGWKIVCFWFEQDYKAGCSYQILKISLVVSLKKPLNMIFMLDHCNGISFMIATVLVKLPCGLYITWIQWKHQLYQEQTKSTSICATCVYRYFR